MTLQKISKDPGGDDDIMMMMRMDGGNRAKMIESSSSVFLAICVFTKVNAPREEAIAGAREKAVHDSVGSVGGTDLFISNKGQPQSTMIYLRKSADVQATLYTISNIASVLCLCGKQRYGEP